MIDGGHVQFDIKRRKLSKLNATLEHSREQIIRIADAVFRVAGERSRTKHGARQPAKIGFPDQLFRDPFALRADKGTT